MIRFARLFPFFLLAMVSGVMTAAADDSSASLGAGGIAFTRAADIRMSSEDLFISPKQVKIRFEFTNDGAKDIDTIVAFPLPDIDTSEFYGSAIGRVTDDPVNFVGFTVVADGRTIVPQVEQRAFIKTREVTAVLKSAGAPLNPTAKAGYETLDKLPPAKKAILLAAHVVEDEGDGTLVPLWVVRTRFYWKQHFPAHKTIVLAHSYQPVTGQAYTEPSYFDGSGENPYQKDYCIDPATQKRLKLVSAARKAGTGDNALGAGMLNVYFTDYILKTATNWKGPIGRFHLTLDKMKPDNTISLCWDGLKKTTPTSFEFSAKDFTPMRDIHMAVFE